MSDTYRIVRSTVADDGTVRIAIDTESMPEPGPDEVVVAVEAAPINPSDLGMLIAGADPESFASVDGALVGTLSPAAMAMNAARVGQPMPCGNEGAGTVVASGSSPGAQALLGSTVSGVSGSMYASHTKLSHVMCIPVPDGVAAADAASSFVNPLTALGMTETMRLEGHSAIVHTAAASNLGQMLNRLCQADGIPLVNVVRRNEQADLLRAADAEHVVVSSADSFADDLTAAITATGATLAFDAIGGGEQVDTLLASMEKASSAGQAFSRYGSDTHKQVYIYGGLDRRRARGAGGAEGSIGRPRHCGAPTACRGEWGDGSSPRSLVGSASNAWPNFRPASPRRSPRPSHPATPIRFRSTTCSIQRWRRPTRRRPPERSAWSRHERRRDLNAAVCP